MKLRFFCGDEELMGIIGESPEEAFNLYQMRIDENAQIENLLFFTVNPDTFKCKTHITIIKDNG